MSGHRTAPQAGDEGGIRRMTLNPDLVRTRFQEIEDSLERLERIKTE